MTFLALFVTEDINSADVKKSFTQVFHDIDVFETRYLCLGSRKAPRSFDQLEKVLNEMGITPNEIPQRYQGVAVQDKAEWISDFHKTFSGKIPIYRFSCSTKDDALSVERIDSPNERHLVVNGVQLH